jgi:BlaI family transcriptional regulator, penicillinase repressor
MPQHTPRQSESKLTPAQLEIMNLFWEHGELGVAQVWKLLSARRRVARNTVQTMLTRLVERGWLQARPEGKAFCFRASRPRKSTLRGMVSQLLDTAFGGSASGMVMALLEARRLSPDEAQRIHALLDGSPEVKK